MPFNGLFQKLNKCSRFSFLFFMFVGLAGKYAENVVFIGFCTSGDIFLFFSSDSFGGKVISYLNELSEFGIAVSNVWRNAILQYLTCDFISIGEALMCRWLAPHSPTKAW